MTQQSLEIIGKYAGLSGFALVFVWLVLSKIIRARLEKTLPARTAFHFYVILVVISAGVGLAGIVAWATVNKQNTAENRSGTNCTSTTGNTSVSGSGNTTVIGGGCTAATINGSNTSTSK